MNESQAPEPSSPPPTSSSPEHLAELYRKMLLIRRLEEEAARAYATGKIGGFLHLYIGQEAIAVGACAALLPEDYVVTTYRDHGLAVAKGMSSRALMAELYGKKTGCSKGLGGSMHMFDAARHMLGGYGIVGGHIPIAAGAAFASKYRGDRRVTLVFYGEGAVSIGGFHEGASLAALWKLPIVFICENNEYAMGTPLSRTISVEDTSLKASGYGMERDRFDDDDVTVVEERIARAVKRAREESLPTMIEVRTYRFRGHSMSDPGRYRTSSEVDDHKQHDPMLLARRQLAEGSYSEERLAALEADVEAEVADAVKFAEESPEPDRSILEATTYDGPFAA